jgi:hypothetical protein
VAGLLALLLLTESRRASRTRPDGSLVLLGDQDRTQWDRALIKEGQTILRRCLRRNQPGPYQLQAAINAVHADAATVEQTDWSQIVALYDQLLAVTPIPVVALNRAIAIGEVHGPAAALALVDQLDLDTYHPYHATRADLLRRLGRNREAAAPTSAQQQWRPQTPSETSSGAVAEPRGQQIGDLSRAGDVRKQHGMRLNRVRVLLAAEESQGHTAPQVRVLYPRAAGAMMLSLLCQTCQQSASNQASRRLSQHRVASFRSVC